MAYQHNVEDSDDKEPGLFGGLHVNHFDTLDGGG